MTSTEPTEWEFARFGSLVQIAKDAVVASMLEAHARAVGAHLGGGGRTEHSYGTQFSVAQFEELADRTRSIEGVELRKPQNAKVQYELPVFLETKTILYPLRYGKDRKTQRDGAKINVSEVRRDLLHTGLASRSVEQFDLFEPVLSDAEIERRQAEEIELLADIEKNGHVVVAGISCSPDGVFDLYWGEIDISEETGRITVLCGESLTNVSAPATGRHLRSVDPTATPPRFDEESEDTGFDLTPNLEPGAVNSEKIPEVDETGSANSE
ncbi:hypothetical protein [Rhodococcus globerulus]|uniref:hypothetical protein n=1 Tax=Rhodococcus globerulus TaxID=33008 RepID=UPI000A7B8796|nr:hypothetical protein [Rhodococcus globerulus]